MSDLPDSMYGISGLAVHVLTGDTTQVQLSKMLTQQVRYMSAFVPTDTLHVFPNPTNAWTQFEYNNYQSGNVQVTIFDMLGRQIRQFVNAYQQNGRYALSFNVADLPAGYYRLNITVNGDPEGIGNIVVVK